MKINENANQSADQDPIATIAFTDEGGYLKVTFTFSNGQEVSIPYLDPAQLLRLRAVAPQKMLAMIELMDPPENDPMQAIQALRSVEEYARSVAMALCGGSAKTWVEVQSLFAKA